MLKADKGSSRLLAYCDTYTQDCDTYTQDRWEVHQSVPLRYTVEESRAQDTELLKKKKLLLSQYVDVYPLEIHAALLLQYMI